MSKNVRIQSYRLIATVIFGLGFCFVFPATSYAQTKINTIDIWVNAFIPRDIPKPDGTSLTVLVPNTGPHAGKTAIKGPLPRH